MTQTPRTINLTITPDGMRRSLQLLRQQLHSDASAVDCIIDLAFSMGANAALEAAEAQPAIGITAAIVAERESLIRSTVLQPHCPVCRATAHTGPDCPHRFGGPNYDHASTPDGV